MEKYALEILNIFEDNGYSAYIVGGYVRDKLLGRDSTDIDICTSATPMEIGKLFTTKTTAKYGSVNIIYKNNLFDITTFRKEMKYELNRKPVKIKYIKKIKKDLLRRDFTINTFCINKDGDVEDILDVMSDLNNHIIKTVGNPRYKIKEDSLRILRAIRFATILDFSIDTKTKYYLGKYGYLLKKLSYQRKKDELNKIFSCPNKEEGKSLILELKLDKSLNLVNLRNIVLCDDIIGIWAQLDVDEVYPFSKIEREQMNGIRELLSKNLYDPYVVYKYDLYLTTVAASILGMDISNINKIYKNLPIYSRKDIVISQLDIAKLLDKEPGNYLKEIINDIEYKIVTGNLINNIDSLNKYILDKYR